jgi:hypothetical protein
MTNDLPSRLRVCGKCGGLGFCGRWKLTQPLLVTCPKCKGKGLD